jgi:hypothetical protein
MEAFESSQGGVAAREAKVGEIDRAARRAGNGQVAGTCPTQP